jgi:hypothetical protein
MQSKSKISPDIISPIHRTTQIPNIIPEKKNFVEKQKAELQQLASEHD